MNTPAPNWSSAVFAWRNMQVVVLIVTVFAVAACEHPSVRYNQFNGRTLEEVVAIIGPPERLSETEATWRHFGDFIAVNYFTADARTTSVTCYFTATLKDGRIIASKHRKYYRGYGYDRACRRFAPWPPLFRPTPPE